MSSQSFQSAYLKDTNITVEDEYRQELQKMIKDFDTWKIPVSRFTMKQIEQIERFTQLAKDLDHQLKVGFMDKKSKELYYNLSDIYVHLRRQVLIQGFLAQ